MNRYDIGFLGGGQLARMSIQAAQRMGLKCISLDPNPTSPASQVADSLVGNFNFHEDISQILSRCSRVTLENEFISPDQLVLACKSAERPESTLIPSPKTLGLINDKLVQRQVLIENGVSSPSAVPLTQDHTKFQFPMIIKARFGGYDGKGTRVILSKDDLENCHDLWSAGGWLAEEFVRFKRELAVMVYRSPEQEGAFPTMETVQTDQVCDLVYPANRDCSAIAIQAVHAVEGFGLFGVELFELHDGSIQVNEIAPRPHNSGHFSLDWGGVSQFEQHIRLVMGWSCEKPAGQPTCMANLLGHDQPGDLHCAMKAALSAVPNCHIHWYGKSEGRSSRKMGHINVVSKDCNELAILARQQFYAGWIS